METILSRLQLIIQLEYGAYQKVSSNMSNTHTKKTKMSMLFFLLEICIHVFADHTHYVQGVTWDPLGQYVATQSSDRSMAIYKYRKNQQGKLVFGQCSRRFSRIDKGKIASTTTTTKPEDPTITGSFRLYHDENLVSFFRRLSFSPDGALLITPAGLNKPIDELDENTDELSNCAYIYPRNTMLK